jgi:hypothetical protein
MSRSNCAITVSASMLRDEHHQRLTGELVDDVAQLQRAAVGGLVELEVKRPHLPGALGPQPPGRCLGRRVSEPAALALALRHPEPLLAPQTLHPLAVHRPAVLAQLVMRTAVSPTRMIDRELPQRRPQRLIVIGALGLVALRGAVLPNNPACPALADAEAVAQHRDRLAPTGRAYQFPRLISFSARTSSAWSATIVFRCRFSRSSSFRRLASCAFIPPYWLRQR